MASASFTLGVAVIFLILCGYIHCFDEQGDRVVEEVTVKDMAVVILSQKQTLHEKNADLNKWQALKGMKLDMLQTIDYVLVHQEWAEHGAWTIFPLIDIFKSEYSRKKWVVVCDEDSQVDLAKLRKALQQYDLDENPFLGRPLRDIHPTIIHHFAFINNVSDFAYPDFEACFALSLPLIRRMSSSLPHTKRYEKRQQFSIDAKHELAKFLLDEIGETLTPACFFCIDPSVEESSGCKCATWQPIRFPTDCPRKEVAKSKLFVAVKTCSKYHGDRVPVVKATWGKEAELIEYYSDVADPAIPTIDLGVPNTEHGHCGKTRAILRHVAADQSRLKDWLLIADDDTIINLERLRQLLACYDDYSPLMLGERYGFGVTYGQGYNYITGGGGMVFNRPAVQLLAQQFECEQDDSPDDMMLGMFFASHGIPVTHSRYFHQARPEDYSPDFLSHQIPVSFHKHWNNDPYKVYKMLTDIELPTAKERVKSTADQKEKVTPPLSKNTEEEKKANDIDDKHLTTQGETQPVTKEQSKESSTEKTEVVREDL